MLHSPAMGGYTNQKYYLFCMKNEVRFPKYQGVVQFKLSNV